MRSGLITGLLACLLAIGVASAAYAGPGLGDTDGDGVDDYFDNCRDVVNHGSTVGNGGQLDTDGDGCGNICDGDYNQDAAVAGTDFLTFKAAFIANTNTFGEDHDGDGAITGTDFLIFKALFAAITPGPSVAAHRDTTACP